MNHANTHRRIAAKVLGIFMFGIIPACHLHRCPSHQPKHVKPRSKGNFLLLNK
jgi:hypothetical protein